MILWARHENIKEVAARARLFDRHRLTHHQSERNCPATNGREDADYSVRHYRMQAMWTGQSRLL